MIRNTNADGSALRVLQHLWELSSSRQNKCVRPWGQRLDKPIGPVIDPSIDTDFGQISADQCEIVLLVRPANPVDSVNGLFVADATSESVARICRVRDQGTVADLFDDLFHATRLRISGVNFNKFGHARIVGEQNGRA